MHVRKQITSPDRWVVFPRIGDLLNVSLEIMKGEKCLLSYWTMHKANFLQNGNLQNTYNSHRADFEVAAYREFLLPCLVGGKE